MHGQGKVILKVELGCEERVKIISFMMLQEWISNFICDVLFLFDTSFDKRTSI